MYSLLVCVCRFLADVDGIGPAFGGAVGCGDVVWLSGSLLRHNSATVAGLSQAQGGGVFAVTALEATGTVFEYNSAVATTGGQSGAPSPIILERNSV